MRRTKMPHGWRHCAELCWRKIAWVILDDSARTMADEAARVHCVVDWFGWVKISRMGSAIAATADRRAGGLIGRVDKGEPRRISRWYASAGVHRRAQHPARIPIC